LVCGVTVVLNEKMMFNQKLEAVNELTTWMGRVFQAEKSVNIKVEAWCTFEETKGAREVGVEKGQW
jgi:hypothetical protein